MTRPLGFFVHHQGRGHAERTAAIVGALPAARPVRIFCARDDIFPPLPPRAEIVRIPSLFERSGGEAAGMSHHAPPDTLHCAPLGWPGIRLAMAKMTAWFASADPALMICDVSAEVAQLSRICSVPHVKVLQHGNRGDEGHRAAYDGAVGLLAPFHRRLAQSDWTAGMIAKTCFAGGLGVEIRENDRDQARRRIDVDPGAELILVLSGGGGNGFAQAPLGVGARSRPDARWITIGHIQTDWHATEPGNIEHRGWVDDATDYLAAADLVIASPGNTTCQQILAAGKPWLAVPEWRYFDEHHRKAEVLADAGVATVRPHLPSSAPCWREALGTTIASHDAGRQRALVEVAPAAMAANWIEGLIATLWSPGPVLETARCRS